MVNSVPEVLQATDALRRLVKLQECRSLPIDDDVTVDDITSAMDFYQQERLDGNALLSDADVATLEGQIKQEAVSSGFVTEAADYLSAVALQTDTFKQRYEVNALSALVPIVSVHNLTVVPSISNSLQHFPGYTGVSVSLQVGRYCHQYRRWRSE